MVKGSTSDFTGNFICLITSREIALVYKLQRTRKSTAEPKEIYAMPMPV